MAHWSDDEATIYSFRTGGNPLMPLPVEKVKSIVSIDGRDRDHECRETSFTSYRTDMSTVSMASKTNGTVSGIS